MRPTLRARAKLLQTRLKNEAFDVLLVLDVDARVSRGFFRQAATYFQKTPCLVSCATFAKTPDKTLLAHVGVLIQALLRLHQEGRAARGQDALLFGSHGYALSRDALDRLGWRTTTGLIAEDMELRLRGVLAGLPIHYAPELSVRNDVTSDPASVHEQRRRWNATYFPLISRYALPLFTQRRWNALFSALLLPSFANLFLYHTIAAGSLGLLSLSFPFLSPYAGIAAVLWGSHVAYFIVAFHTLDIPLGRRELAGFVTHLTIRAAALVEGIFLARVKDWAPAPHEGDR
jgi:cellulose synthase/poly-beta-1,6-N-acetylglucosamine synthase-like glycosyltransferase